jgi:hypothetical protein
MPRIHMHYQQKGSNQMQNFAYVCTYVRTARNTQVVLGRADLRMLDTDVA